SKEWPERLTFRCEMKRLKEGGLSEIKEWIASARDPRLGVIDTLAMIKTPSKKKQTQYEADYDSVVDLRTFAHRHGCAVGVVHRQRKMEADDVFDTVSGTLGLTGAPDTILVLETKGDRTTLHGRGRDMMEIEKAIVFDKDKATWTITGDASAVH